MSDSDGLPSGPFSVCTTHKRFHPCGASVNCTWSSTEADVFDVSAHIMSRPPTQRGLL